MKSVFFACIAVIAMALSPCSASAAGIAPPDYNFLLTGNGNLINGGSSWACQWTFNVKSGPDAGGGKAAGGTMSGGSATAGTGCSVMTMAASTWSITSSTATGGTGVFHGLSFYQSGIPYCSTTSDVAFTVTNNGAAPSTFVLNYPTIGTCTMVASLNTASNLDVVP